MSQYRRKDIFKTVSIKFRLFTNINMTVRRIFVKSQNTAVVVSFHRGTLSRRWYIAQNV